MAMDAPAMAPLLKSGKKFAFLIENFCGLLGKCDNLTSSTGKDSLILGERWYIGYPFRVETISVAIPG